MPTHDDLPYCDATVLVTQEALPVPLRCRVAATFARIRAGTGAAAEAAASQRLTSLPLVSRYSLELRREE
jgi:hypothetical protein